MSSRFLLKTVALSVVIITGLLWQKIFSSDGQVEPVVDESVDFEPAKTATTAPAALDFDTDGITGSELSQRQAILDLYAKEQFTAAYQLLESELADQQQDSAYRRWLERQIPVLLTSIGWQYASANQCDEAMAYFEKALSHRQEPFAIKGTGFCYYQRKDFWQAEPFLNRYVSLRGSLEYDSAVILADTLESLQQYGKARDVLKKAVAQGGFAATEAKNLAARLRAMEAKVREFDNQAVISTDLISLSYRSYEHEDLANWVLTVLEEAMDELAIDLGLPRPGSPLEVLLYPVKTFRAVAHGPTWASGLYDGRLRIPVSDRRDASYLTHLKQTLRHELVHGVLSEATAGRSLPTWFHEGLATVMECPGKCSKRPLPMNRSVFLPLAKLEGLVSWLWPSRSQASLCAELLSGSQHSAAGGRGWTSALTRACQVSRGHGLEEPAVTAERATCQGLRVCKGQLAPRC